jgi:hypothetical protein
MCKEAAGDLFEIYPGICVLITEQRAVKDV